jgi:spore maturation protein SpmB
MTIYTFRAPLGAADPTDVFIPLLIATFCSALTGVLVTGAVQRLRLLQPVTLAYLGGMSLVVASLVTYFVRLDRQTLERQTSLLANLLIFSLIVGFMLLAARRRVPLYETFVEGAKGGFTVAIGIVPYLVAMLVAIGVLRGSGALERLLDVVRWGVSDLGFDTRWVDALPVALMRPLSGSGSRGLVIETMKTFGADSFAGRLACVIQGSTETTFYVIAVYFGSVGVKNTRHAIACGLTAEFAGFLAAVAVSYMFFG